MPIALQTITVNHYIIRATGFPGERVDTKTVQFSRYHRPGIRRHPHHHTNQVSSPPLRYAL